MYLRARAQSSSLAPVQQPDDLTAITMTAHSVNPVTRAEAKRVNLERSSSSSSVCIPTFTPTFTSELHTVFSSSTGAPTTSNLEKTHIRNVWNSSATCPKGELSSSLCAFQTSC